MIVVIFISARAHMQYLRCSLVIYAFSRVVSQCNGERCLCAIKVNVLPLSFVTKLNVNRTRCTGKRVYTR